MLSNPFFLKNLLFFLSRLLFRQLRGLRGNLSSSRANQIKLEKLPSHPHTSHNLSNSTLIFDVEGSLLKSSSLFPYFMLVAFEAGSIIRAFLLLVSYPFTCLVREEVRLKIMVMISFFGIRKDSFRVGRSVLPKFFLEDVGFEMFELFKKARKNIGISDLPQVMIEIFLMDHLQIHHVVGRDLKVFYGYYVGLLEKRNDDVIIEKVITEENGENSDIIGFFGFQRFLRHRSLSQYCMEIHLVRKAEKRGWETLPREKLPKPLIFHDGRLAFRPFPLEALAMFMWVPFGFMLGVIRIMVSLSLPFKTSTPILVFCGLRLTTSKPKNSASLNSGNGKCKGLLYVCNHRTLLDPLYLAFILQKNITAVTYSLSRFSEIIAPIKTVRLARDREQDAMMMETLLKEGDLVVCPEGTTCREPYLLRFSPLFAELSHVIVPAALNSEVSMFHGTTAGGLKCFDPLFFLINPSPSYTAQLLPTLPGLSTCPDSLQNSRYDVANTVQREIAKALGFQCTMLTRRDKYRILAGNEGVAGQSNQL